MSWVTGYLTAIKQAVLGLERRKAALLLFLISYPSLILVVAAIVSIFLHTLPIGTTLLMLSIGLNGILLVLWLLNVV